MVGMHLGVLFCLSFNIHLYLTQAASCRPFNWVYPPPRNVSNDLITSAGQAFNATFTQLLQNATVAAVLNTTSFSLEAYSLYDAQPMLTFHHSAPSLASSEEGVTEVNSDTVYRMASISKALTMYIYLLAAGDTSFNDPITDYVPELAQYAAGRNANDAVNIVDWSSITIRALASHLSGSARDPFVGSQTDLVNQQLLALPPPETTVPNSDFCAEPPETVAFACNRTAFFNTNLFRPPTVAPFSSPVYANNPFQILSYALENITGTSFPDLFQSYLVEEHGLQSTFYSAPPNSSNSVIPYNSSLSLYGVDFREGAPFGGYYSTVNDLTTIGRAILNSTFLSPAQVKRWLKPVSFLPPSVLTDNAGVFQAVGTPWEIYRAPAPLAPLSGLPAGQNASAAQKYQTWLYTKEGDTGLYSTLMALVPEFNVGFEVLAAGTLPRPVVLQIADFVTEFYVPALFETSRLETAQTYAGTFTDESSNSSATFEIAGPNGANQGLILRELVYNGTNFYNLFGSVLYGLPDPSILEITLFPDGLQSQSGADGAEVEGWRSVITVPGMDGTTGAFSSSCWQWSGVGGLEYGGNAFDDFRFTVQSGDGRMAVGLEVPSLRLNMTRAE